MNTLYPIIRRKRRPLILEGGSPPVVAVMAAAPPMAEVLPVVKPGKEQKQAAKRSEEAVARE
jgi:hypothetical protein